MPGTELGDWGFMPTDPAPLRRELETARSAADRRLRPGRSGGSEPLTRTARPPRFGPRALLRDAGATEALIVLSDDNGRCRIANRTPAASRRARAADDASGRRLPQGAERVARAVADRDRTPHRVSSALWRLCRNARRDRCTDAPHRSRAARSGASTPVTSSTAAAIRSRCLEAHADRVWHVHFKDCDLRVADSRAREQGSATWPRCARSCSASLAPAPWTLRSVTALRRARATTAGSWSSRTCFPGYGTPKASAQAKPRLPARAGALERAGCESMIPAHEDRRRVEESAA